MKRVKKIVIAFAAISTIAPASAMDFLHSLRRSPQQNSERPQELLQKKYTQALEDFAHTAMKSKDYKSLIAVIEFVHKWHDPTYQVVNEQAARALWRQNLFAERPSVNGNYTVLDLSPAVRKQMSNYEPFQQLIAKLSPYLDEYAGAFLIGGAVYVADEEPSLQTVFHDLYMKKLQALQRLAVGTEDLSSLITLAEFVSLYENKVPRTKNLDARKILQEHELLHESAGFSPAVRSFLSNCSAFQEFVASFAVAQNDASEGDQGGKK